MMIGAVHEPADRSDSTHLAYERTEFAAERTLQAWIRTALSMISFGFTIGKLGQAAQQWSVQGPVFNHEWGVSGLAYTLVVMGIASLVVASVQNVVIVRDLRRRSYPARLGLAFSVAVALAVLGAFALTSLVLNI